MNGIESLGTYAVDVAMRSAAAYVRQHKLTVDPDALLACLRSWIKAKLPKALDDAKQALDCGMGKLAEATFHGSIAIAGIEAAKEAGHPA